MKQHELGVSFFSGEQPLTANSSHAPLNFTLPRFHHSLSQGTSLVMSPKRWGKSTNYLDVPGRKLESMVSKLVITYI